MALSVEQIAEAEAHVDYLYKLSQEKDDNFAEAQAQWLESCLESPEQYDEVLVGLKYLTLCWLEGQMNDVDQDQLDPGGLYYWMTEAVDQSDEW